MRKNYRLVGAAVNGAVVPPGRPCFRPHLFLGSDIPTPS